VRVITGRTGNEQVNWQVGRTSHGPVYNDSAIVFCMAVWSLSLTGWLRLM